MSGPESLAGKNRKPMPLTAKVDVRSEAEILVSVAVNESKQLENEEGKIDQKVENPNPPQEESPQ